MTHGALGSWTHSVGTWREALAVKSSELVGVPPDIEFFFFQAEDGIRDWSVTGVQTCALPISPTTSSPLAWTRPGKSSASGANDLPSRGSPASRRNLGAADPPAFPPSVVLQVKALARELPHRLQLPLSQLSLSEIRREAITRGLVAEISGATLWRWLSADALRPWRHRGWIFPRDPDFAAKAGRILDLYDRVWQGRALNAREFVISADEKSSIQAHLVRVPAKRD